MHLGSALCEATQCIVKLSWIRILALFSSVFLISYEHKHKCIYFEVDDVHRYKLQVFVRAIWICLSDKKQKGCESLPD